MKRNNLSELERTKSQIQLQTALTHTVEHESESPFVDFKLGKYEGDIEPILVAICQALRWGAKSIMDNLEPEQKSIVVKWLLSKEE